MIVDVIIPSKTSEKLSPILAQCIGSLKASEDEITFNVVVVESGEQIDCGQNKTIVYDRDEFCYNHALNMGIKATKSEWVILANNDLIFRHLFMSEIVFYSAMMPTVKSFSPWNSHGGWHDNLFGDSPLNRAFFGYRTCYELTGWCIIVKREILEKIDLSERVNFWYSDNVYADELIKINESHALIRASKVDHLCSQTIDFSQYNAEIDRASYEVNDIH